MNTERRASDRFPIERDLRYKILNKKTDIDGGVGKTINMSSGGLLFSTEHLLLPGKRLEVALSWPAQLNNTTPLKLVARGKIVRCESGRAAMCIEQYEFRTQAVGAR